MQKVSSETHALIAYVLTLVCMQFETQRMHVWAILIADEQLWCIFDLPAEQTAIISALEEE